MKKIFTLLAFVITVLLNAQAPQGFNYQATIRNNTGQLLINQNVLVKFNILQNATNGTVVYSENQTANTDDLGNINLVVGQGAATIGTFSNINWGSGSYFLGIELNTGNGFVAMGTTQLLSVPYALYANSSGSVVNISNLVYPSIVTNQATNITGSGAVFSATINNANINQINKAGFVYSTNPNPIYDLFGLGENLLEVPLTSNTFIHNSSSATAVFPPNTLYYVRAFVVTENNTVVYSNEITFTTTNYYQTGNGVTDFNGNTYPSIVLNNLEWMQKNLNVSNYTDGTPIPQVTDPAQLANLTTGAWCYYNNDPANGSIYGKLYNWYAIAGIYDTASLNNPLLRKKLAPQGWHLPSDIDVTQLIDYLGGISNGGKMKETGTTHWINPNLGASNLSNFTGLPGGSTGTDANLNYVFKNLGRFGLWWTSDYGRFFLINSSNQCNLNQQQQGITPENYEAYSVRCVKD